MKRLTMVLALCVGPLAADPLKLVDYEALFAANPDAVENVSEVRSILRVGDVTVLHDTTEARPYTGLDESGEGAVGCFVSILSTIESALQACDANLPAEQAAIQATYLDEALDFYAANALPATTRAEVDARFADLVASQIEGALPYCQNLDVVTNLADRIFTADSRDEITGMMSVPRLPVSNPCL
jgi:hypothetical protein